MKMNVTFLAEGRPNIKLPTLHLGDHPATLTEKLPDGTDSLIVLAVQEDGGYVYSVAGSENYEIGSLRGLEIKDDTEFKKIVGAIKPGETFEYQFIHRSGIKTTMQLIVET